MLWKRVLSAIIPLPGVLILMQLGPTWAWMIFVATAATIAHWEYLTITGRGGFSTAEKVLFTAAGCAALWGFQYLPGYFLEMVLGLLFLSFIWVLARPGDLATAFPRTAALYVGFLYVPFLLSFVGRLHGMGPEGWKWIYIAFFVAWLGDTGAYFAGRAFGRHKLYPLVSPKKTWEGAIGGLLGSLAGVIATKLILLPVLTWADCFFIAIPGGVLGQVGDLCESLLKRSYDVKDSGSIMPGHGGILDRSDALMFVAPYIYVYATRLQPLVL